MSFEKQLSLLALLASLSLALTGCPSSPCTGEFISQNESCAPGCEGIRVIHYPAPCGTAGGDVTWCVPPTPGGTSEDERCIIDDDTNEVYRQPTYPDARFVPANVRYCTSEEQQSRMYCSNP